MASLIPDILNSITPTRLRELCEQRGLPTGGDQGDKRTRLARSMRGQLEELMPLLKRTEIAAFLGHGTFSWPNGVEGEFTRVSQATRPQLEELLRLVAADDPRAYSSSRPLGRSCQIRFWASNDEEEEDDEEDDDEDEGEIVRGAEKVARLGVKRDDDLMYYVKDGDVWAVPRKVPGKPRGQARIIRAAGITMDYSQYLYFLDADGDIARKRRHLSRAPVAPAVPVAHGAIVAARYRGEVHEPARVIRVDEETGDVLVHWYDDRFSEVDAEDIVRLSDKPWTLAKLGENEVELEDEVDDDASLDERFLAWLGEHLDARPRVTLLIKTLVNRLARFTADQRLSTRAVVDLGRVLAEGGYQADPDLQTLTRSPGIAARVTVTRAAGAAAADLRGAAPAARPAPAPAPTPTPVRSPYEQVALRLQFLVQNAAAIRRLDEGERRRAVEFAARGAGLGAADQIRLRALAHQYATDHTDLGPVVAQLRVLLAPALRAQLLADLRELCPPGADLDDLVAVYEIDLDVPVAERRSAEPVVAVVAPPPPLAPVPEPAAPTDEPASAGGIRANALLDSLFAEEP